MRNTPLILSSIFWIIIINNIYPQEIITSGGDYFSSTTSSMSITIGEPVIETYRSSSYILTQGFQQCLKFLAIGNVEVEDVKFNVRIYPNPAVTFLRINVEYTGNQIIRYKLFASSGKLISEGQLGLNETDINIHQLPSSNLLLTIYADHQEILTRKIIKR
jgi:hypothetical protein